MDDLLYARLQMAISLGFHIVFASIGIAMPLLMVLAEWRWIRTGSAALRELSKHWAKGTAIFFAVGAVSGTVLSFELGLLWPRFMQYAGGIIGLPFGLEGLAFFTEAIFLGVYLYAWDKVNRWMHLASGAIVAISGAMSALFVIMANAWMNAPAGFDFDPVTREFSNIDPIAAMFNPAWKAQVVHMLVAAYMATAFAVAGVHALQLLRGRHTEFNRVALFLAMITALPMTLVQPLVGDWAATVVALNQPAKLAAMEGQFATERHAPLRIGGLPNVATGSTDYAIEIPGFLSYLAYGDFDAEVKGLNDFPRDEWPPVLITHIAFQLMVAFGTIMLGVSAWWALAVWRPWNKRVAGMRFADRPVPRLLLWAIVCCAPLGFLAIECGWVVTEVGRQPWIIHGVMRTAESVTPMRGLIAPFITFTVVYIFLAIAVVYLMMRQVRLSAAPVNHHSKPNANAD